MITKRISLALLFQIAFISLTFGQTINLSSKLTKKQMYKDFDKFVQIIDSSTQTLVRKIATGYDAAEEIRQRRSQIEKINSHGEFLHFLNNCLPLTMAEHAEMTENHQCWGNTRIDTQIVKPLYQAYEKYVKNLPIDYMKGMGLGNGFYYKGEYYVEGKHIFTNRYTSDTVILSNFRVLKHNNEPIGTLKNSQITDSPSSYRWDYERQRYYSVYGASFVSRQDRITAEDYTTKKIIELDMKDCRRAIYSSLSDDILASLPEGYVKSDNMKVTYYDSLNLLYIYMGAMREDDAFVDSIKKIGVGKQIDKVILDVRGNSGGSDAAWENVLQAIIKKPLPIRGRIGIRNTEVMRKIWEELAEDNDSVFIQKIPFLDSVEFLVYVYGGLNENGDTISYVPDTNSLQYDGKIYILQDKFVFSSTGTLLANAKLHSQLVSVGEPSELILGRGAPPGIFQLPESKFTFLLDFTIDLTNCKTVFDVFQDRPKIEIEPTLEEIIEMKSYEMFLNNRGDDFLFNHDYLFKKVLEMK